MGEFIGSRTHLKGGTRKRQQGKQRRARRRVELESSEGGLRRQPRNAAVDVVWRRFFIVVVRATTGKKWDAEFWSVGWQVNRPML